MAARITAKHISVEPVFRPYDLHRPDGCTSLVIRRDGWEGNEIGLWLPELISIDGRDRWNNWSGARSEQRWVTGDGGWLHWQVELEGMRFASHLRLDPHHDCLWFRHTLTNPSPTGHRTLETGTCLHMADAPQFISVRGERLWACLDGAWTSTDTVPRDRSLDPRRVKFLRRGARSERSIVHVERFPHSIMPQAAHHPLIVAEAFDQTASVGIAASEVDHLFNNNDSILRCIHSEPPAVSAAPGESAVQEGLILFAEGAYRRVVAQHDRIAPARWERELG